MYLYMCVYVYVNAYMYIYICMSVSCHVYVLFHDDHNSNPNLPDRTPIYRIDQRICYFLIASLSLLLKLL